MDFNLTGIKPKSEKGKTFSNTVWLWHPLWDYVCRICYDIFSEKERVDGHYDRGCLIDADKAERIAIALDSLLRDGFIASEEKRFKKRIKKLPDEICFECNGAGRVIQEEQNFQISCKICKGMGRIKNRARDYTFTEENVKEFVEFCKESGGFSIAKGGAE